MPTLIRFSFVLLVLSLVEGKSQSLQSKQISTAQQSWIGYFNQTRFSKRWGLATDIHYRRTGEFIQQNSFIFIRSGLTYYITDYIRLLAGYAYLYLFESDGVKGIHEQDHGNKSGGKTPAIGFKPPNELDWNKGSDKK